MILPSLYMGDANPNRGCQAKESFFKWPDVVEDRNSFIRSSIPEELFWDRPFVDTGRGPIPVLSVAENQQFNPPSETWDHFLTHRLRYLVAGGLAGGLTRCITHPFDRARTSMQLFGHAEPQFKSMSSTFKFFWTAQGKFSFWRGLDISLIKIVPEISLKFAVYEDVKNRFRKRHYVAEDGRRHASFNDRFIAGCAAGLVSHSATFPVSVVAVRMAAQRPFKSEFNGIFDAFRKLYLTHGLLGFYRGFLVSLCAIVPGMGLDFAIYGSLKKVYKRYFHTEGTHPPVWVLLTCGATSSSLTHLMVYPLLIPKIMIQAADPKALQIQTFSENVLGYLHKVYKTQGLGGVYRGLTPSLIKVVPAVSLSYCFYERINQQLSCFVGSDVLEP